MGSTTYKEFRQHFEKDRALVRRSRRSTSTNRPSRDTIKILKGLKTYYEDFHKLKYTDDAIKTAVELSARYITDRKLPGQGQSTLSTRRAPRRCCSLRTSVARSLGSKDIEAVIAKMARSPGQVCL